MTESGLSPLGQLIFNDRYAVKRPVEGQLQPGRLVVVCPDPKVVARALATVIEHNVVDRTVLVETRDGEVTVPENQVDVPQEVFSQAKDRLAHTVAMAEEPERQRGVRSTFRALFGEGDTIPSYVPAGRIWAGAGVEEKLTPYNCFVLGNPHDSRKGIFTRLEQWAETMSRGGGVGITMQSLRPRHALVRGVNGRSSGPTSWSELFSGTTGLIQQGGSRRGAAMLIQAIWHPDIEEFITAKTDFKRLNNANVSVAVTDAFMRALDAEGDWDLVFPRTDHPAYDTEWHGDIELWQAKGYPIEVHRTVKARDLWNLIVNSAWKSAEPGIIFIDRVNQQSNSYYYASGRIYATNPCAEQPLPAWSVCNLGHINLTRFLIGDGMYEEPASTDWVGLAQAIRAAVRFQDNIIDIAHYPLPEFEAQQRSERRIGMGTLGLGEYLIRKHIRYGNNPECLAELDALYRFIAVEAYTASSELAAEKGSFPNFDADKFLDSGFCKGLPEGLRDLIRRQGMRNVTVLTQAPTGSVGTMVGSSTGIEPYFSWGWERRGRLGAHMEACGVYLDYLAAHSDVKALREALSLSEQCSSNTHLPPWFVATPQLTPADHAYTQAAIQRWVCSALSKTSNVPEDFTPEQVGEYYRLLHRLGCKGGTVYRDNSRNEQVLNRPKEELEEKAVPPVDRTVQSTELFAAPQGVYSMLACSMTTPVGRLSTKVGMAEGQPFEVWCDVSRGGTSLAAVCEAQARLVSLILRLPSPLARTDRLRLAAEQLRGIGGGDAEGFGPNRVLSLPDGIGKSLEQVLGSSTTPQALNAPSIPAPPLTPSKGDLCPSCGQATLVRSEGCYKCVECGYSKC